MQKIQSIKEIFRNADLSAVSGDCIFTINDRFINLPSRYKVLEPLAPYYF
jgi:hypothetical protein